MVALEFPLPASLGAVELLGWCYPAECFTGTFVQFGSGVIASAFSDSREVEAAGQVLPDQPVRVLVRSSLPG